MADSNLASMPSLPQAPTVASFHKDNKSKAAQVSAQIQSSYDLAKYQNDYNYWSWQQQNDYNSPVAQMQRFKEAGLNPNLIYKQGDNGNSSSMQGAASPQQGVTAAFSQANSMAMAKMQNKVALLNAIGDVIKKGADTASMLNGLRSEIPQASYTASYYRGLDPAMASSSVNSFNKLSGTKNDWEYDRVNFLNTHDVTGKKFIGKGTDLSAWYVDHPSALLQQDLAGAQSKVNEATNGLLNNKLLSETLPAQKSLIGQNLANAQEQHELMLSSKANLDANNYVVKYIVENPHIADWLKPVLVSAVSRLSH